MSNDEGGMSKGRHGAAWRTAGIEGYGGGGIGLFVLTAFFCGCDHPNQGILVDLGDHMFLHRVSASDTMIAEKVYQPDSPQIPPMVVSCGRTGRVIVAVRVPLMRRSPDNPRDTYTVPDWSHQEYWLLDCAMGKSHGPFTEAECREAVTERGLKFPRLNHVSTIGGPEDL